MDFPLTFNEETVPLFCDELAKHDEKLGLIIERFGYPPCWKREPGFETLVYIILEQQVSLASAKAAYDKLKEVLPVVTPEGFLLLDDATLRASYFSRQKMIYTRHLASSVLNKTLDPLQFPSMSNDEIRTELTKVKGIGNWTVDVYLMMALNRTDLFPLGDVALIKSLKETEQVAEAASKEDLASLAMKWAPYQTIAAYLLWHNYLCLRKKKDQQLLVPVE